MRKIVVTGAAGLVGLNLVARLKDREDLTLVGIDKHAANVALFRKIFPQVPIIEADLARPGAWEEAFAGADAVVINQAQIGGLVEQEFIDNNVVATRHILAAMKAHQVGYFVGISSSVVNSRADDFYTRSKTAQEEIYRASGIDHVVLRPTLMFGWFDRKHLGWLRRFMDRTPVFPIPGNGQYLRQPLYVGDFVAIIDASLRTRATGIHDISGHEKVTYDALIAMIHATVKPRARLVHIPYTLFWWLLWLYARFDRNPPFTTNQLEALVIPEEFAITDWPGTFGVTRTPLRQALAETYLDPVYGPVALSF